MATQEIRKDHLEDYFNHFSTIMPAELVEIEVAGLDIGDQVEAEWLPLNGISYDPKDDAVVVDLGDGRIEHLISRPVEVVVDEGVSGINSISIRDGDDKLHVLRLKEPRALPSAA